MRSILFALVLGACVAPSPSDGRDDTFLAGGKTDSGISEGSPEAALDCNTSVGPDQQVTVISDGSSLTLRELTTSGATVERSLSATEWLSGTLTLREDFGTHATMKKETDGWWVHDSGSLGVADCWVDKSQ